MDQACQNAETGDWQRFCDGFAEATKLEQSMTDPSVEESSVSISRQTLATQIFLTRCGSILLSALKNYGMQCIHPIQLQNEMLMLNVALKQILGTARLFMRYQASSVVGCFVDLILDICLSFADQVFEGVRSDKINRTVIGTSEIVSVCYILLAERREACNFIYPTIHCNQIKTLNGSPTRTILPRTKATVLDTLLARAPERVLQEREKAIRSLMHVLQPGSSAFPPANSAKERMDQTILRANRRSLKGAGVSAVCHRCGRYRYHESAGEDEMVKPYPACSRCKKATFCSAACQKAGM